MYPYKQFKTADGSDSLWVESLDETYHSRHGAIQESQHVFIDNGLLKWNAASDDIIRVFEVGFGTGLNALLTWKAAMEKSLKVVYYSIEKYPVPEVNIVSLNYPELSGLSQDCYDRLHSAPWGEKCVLDNNLTLFKEKMDLDAINLVGQFDLVYYDAFGPRVQPNMWTLNKLKVVYNGLAENGLLVTYCAQGQFRRNLKTLGFEWESLPGPPGKREMTRAIKKSQ